MSLEIQLINCKVELKLKWTKHCFLTVGGTDNADLNSDNIIFTIRETKLCVPVVTFSGKTIRNYQNVLAKGLNDTFIEWK